MYGCCGSYVIQVLWLCNHLLTICVDRWLKLETPCHPLQLSDSEATGTEATPATLHFLPSHRQFIRIQMSTVHLCLICLTCWTPVWTYRWYSPPAGSSAARKHHACPEPPHVCRTGIGSGHQTSTSHLLLGGTDLTPVDSVNPWFSMTAQGFNK